MYAGVSVPLPVLPVPSLVRYGCPLSLIYLPLPSQVFLSDPVPELATRHCSPIRLPRSSNTGERTLLLQAEDQKIVNCHVPQFVFGLCFVLQRSIAIVLRICERPIINTMAGLREN